MNYKQYTTDILTSFFDELDALSESFTRSSDRTKTVSPITYGKLTISPNGVECTEKRKPVVPSYEINSILANPAKGAFTVVWADGTHTMIHLQEGDVWDNEKALAMCFVKKMMGNTGKFNDIFTEVLPSRLKVVPEKKKKKEKTATPSSPRVFEKASRARVDRPSTPKTGPVQLVMVIDRTDLDEDEDDSFSCDFQY